MTIYSVLTIECDGLSCGASFESNSDDYQEARRQAAAEEGWTYDYEADEDYCSQDSGK